IGVALIFLIFKLVGLGMSDEPKNSSKGDKHVA
ncbi:hypothetical protein LCGC14_2842790, partial [marine sediment metagenome]